MSTCRLHPISSFHVSSTCVDADRSFSSTCQPTSSQPYVFNKLKLLACPFLHKGSWARIPERDADRGLAFKPPRGDINAPDLYIPLMGFASYVLTNCILQVRSISHWSPYDPVGVVNAVP